MAESSHSSRKKGNEASLYKVGDISLPLSCIVTSNSIERALAVRFQPSDVVLSSYPKCDSEIVDTIVWKLLYENIKHPAVCSMTNRFVPCIEMTKIDDLSYICDHIIKNKLPKLFKTYLPFKLIHSNKRAKYIYVVRTPWEACSSYYTYLVMTGVVTDTFDVFVEDFMKGDVPYGSYFKHVHPWSKRILDNNVLILCREHVENNPRSAMFNIAAFLGEKYLKRLIDREEYTQSIMEATSWENREKEKYLPRQCLAHPDGSCIKIHVQGNIVRSKLKEVIDEVQLRDMTEIISRHFEDSSIEFLWKSLLKKQMPSMFG